MASKIELLIQQLDVVKDELTGKRRAAMRKVIDDAQVELKKLDRIRDLCIENIYGPSENIQSILDEE